MKNMKLVDKLYIKNVITEEWDDDSEVNGLWRLSDIILNETQLEYDWDTKQDYIYNTLKELVKETIETCGGCHKRKKKS